MKHYHYEVQAFNSKAPYMDPNMNPLLKKDNYQMGDLTIVDVFGLSEKEAIAKAKTILSKKFYRIGKVYECHSPEYDPDLQQEVQIAQLEMQKKMLDAVRGHN